MLLRVHPVRQRAAECRPFTVPASKPETQRALVLGALADGTSVIRNDLRCLETRVMQQAMRAFGARISSEEDQLTIAPGRDEDAARTTPRIICCDGSGLVARVSAALAFTQATPTVITGDDILRGREMQALFSALERGNRPIAYLAQPYHLPIVVTPGTLKGGTYELPGDVSSQFVSALLLSSPLATDPVTIKVAAPVLCGSYIRQTVAAMQRAGVTVHHEANLSELHVVPAPYRPFVATVGADYTSASYFLAAAALSEGPTTLRRIGADTLQGEAAFVEVLRELGVRCDYDAEAETLNIRNDKGELRGDYHFDVSDCPNIVPTLATLGSFVEGRFRVTGASIVRFHKSPRIDAMIGELRKLGVQIVPVMSGRVVDGFEVRGRASYRGGASFSSWRDHRVFMSLFLTALRTREPSTIDGYNEVENSFPGFLEQFATYGIRCEQLDGAEMPKQDAALGA